MDSETKRRRIHSRNQTELQPGYRVMCRWRDGKFRKAKIIEKRLRHAPHGIYASNDPPDDVQLQYYVHYLDRKRFVS